MDPVLVIKYFDCVIRNNAAFADNQAGKLKNLTKIVAYEKRKKLNSIVRFQANVIFISDFSDFFISN